MPVSPRVQDTAVSLNFGLRFAECGWRSRSQAAIRIQSAVRIPQSAIRLLPVVVALFACSVTAGSRNTAIGAAQGGGPSDADLVDASGDRVVRIGLLQGGGRARVVTLPLEPYIAGVLAGEGEPKAGPAAQQTLAITARTYVLANLDRHGRDGYDLCDSTHCQVLRQTTAASRLAAFSTVGRILVFNGVPAPVYYSASCGGRTELPSEVWPDAVDYPYERSLEDDACRDDPGWENELELSTIERALKAAGFRGRRLRDVKVASRNGSGRVRRLRLDGLSPGEIAGNEFRLAVGPTIVRSTAFELRKTRTGIRFTGRGYGHGVGLCVIGAGHRAARGESADDILGFYFPGIRVQPVEDVPALASALRRGAPPVRLAAPAVRSPVADPRATAAPVTADAPATTSRAGITVTVPGTEAAVRPELEEIARRGREQIAKALGIAPPAEVRLRVYDSVDRFRAETGRPWWVNAVTTGAVIELPPTAILRQRGVLERTVREEIGRVLLDPLLHRRPLWVRVGLARHLAEPDAEAPAPGRAARLRCPADAELAMAVSAAAQREAEARAETCVALALARGKSWRDIK